MGNWKFRLDLKDIWEKSSREVEETYEVPVWFIEELIARMKILLGGFHSIPKYAQYANQLENFILELQKMKSDGPFEKDSFNAFWDRVYDWADQKVSNEWPPETLCWIETRS